MEAFARDVRGETTFREETRMGDVTRGWAITVVYDKKDWVQGLMCGKK